MSDPVLFTRELKQTHAIDVDSLQRGAIRTTPTNYGFSPDRWEAEEDGWRYIVAVQCEDCGGIYIADGPTECENLDCENYGGEIGSGDDGPMMSYYYELPTDPSDAAIAELVELPVCVVYIDGEPGLALTGGGMDLSWEICEAFMRLGYLPPLHFAGLPAIAGRGTSKDDLAIGRACERTAREAIEIYTEEGLSALRSIEHALSFERERQR